MISAYIEITRNDETLIVYLSGHTETFRSPNPYETGERLVDWSVVSPHQFDLTHEEEVRAEEALERAI